MPPGWCPEHGPLMRSIGAIEQAQEDQCREIKEIKGLLQDLIKKVGEEKAVSIEEKTKSGMLYWTISILVIALVSAATNWIMRKLCG